MHLKAKNAILISALLSISFFCNAQSREENSRKIAVTGPSVNVFYKYFAEKNYIDSVRFFQDYGLYIQSTRSEAVQLADTYGEMVINKSTAYIWIEGSTNGNHIAIMSLQLVLPDEQTTSIYYQDMFAINPKAAEEINKQVIQALNQYGIVNSCANIQPKKIDYKKYDDIPFFGFTAFFRKLFVPGRFHNYQFYTDSCFQHRTHPNDFYMESNEKISHIEWYVYYDKIILSPRDILSRIETQNRLKITLSDGSSSWIGTNYKLYNRFDYEAEMILYINACIVQEYLSMMPK